MTPDKRRSFKLRMSYKASIILASLVCFAILFIAAVKLIANESQGKTSQQSVSRMLEEMRESTQMAILLRQRELPEEKEKGDELLKELNHQLVLVRQMSAMLLGEEAPSPRPTVSPEPPSPGAT